MMNILHLDKVFSTEHDALGVICIPSVSGNAFGRFEFSQNSKQSFQFGIVLLAILKYAAIVSNENAYSASSMTTFMALALFPTSHSTKVHETVLAIMDRSASAFG